ncbi:hypothetical protein MSP8887_03601 [Marinomonas spartinae]|uniref:hypothetical protein n=1 Tax=Marinomonas spartinae TaxID=1792290 RepID=UPI000808B91D|nr:hypothetical protein [Marinomonas spartinae]SBS39014.1 hypothetical protein MSP8887_03601 [Marinomonas spartinae]
MLKFFESFLVVLVEKNRIVFYTVLGLIPLLSIFEMQIPEFLTLIWLVFIAMVTAAQYRNKRDDIGWLVYPIFIISFLILYKTAYFIGDWADKFIHH